MLRLCVASFVTNQFPLSRVVLVVPAAASCQVIDDAVLVSVPPFSCTTNWGSVAEAGGIGVGLRQGGNEPALKNPPTTVTPAGMPAELSHVWSVGVGKVAP